MAVDSYKWLPGSLANYYRALPIQKAEPIPWTPLAKPSRSAASPWSPPLAST
jgi:hypothetical protein